MSKLLTLAIPTYNAEKCLPQLFHSLTDQDFSKCSVCISDDGSSDGTMGLVQAFSVEHPGVVNCTSHGNIGVGATRNLMMESIDSQYVWFIDHDDEIRPGCLAELVKVLEGAEPEILWIERVIFSEMADGWPATVSYEPRQVTRETAMALMDFPPWRKIYAVSLLKDAGVKFTHYFGEDIPQTLHAVACAERLFRVDAPIYRHIPLSTAITMSPVSDWMMTTAPETLGEIRNLERRFPQYREILEFRAYEFIVWILKYLKRHREQFPDERKIDVCILKFDVELDAVCGAGDNPYIEIAKRSKTDLLEQKSQRLSEKIQQIEKAYQNSFSWRVTAPMRRMCDLLTGGRVP